jgi:hypothetical protein
MPPHSPASSNYDANSPQVRWRLLLIGVGIQVFNTVQAGLAGAPDLWANFKTGMCIVLAILGLFHFFVWVSRGRIPPSAIFLVEFPLAYLIGDKVGAFLGGDDYIAYWVRAHTVGRSVASGYLSAVLALIFANRFFYASAYRTAWESERRRTAEIERAQAVSELALLQAQIEPHFLFNTLSHVQGTVEHEPAVAKNMLEHLSVYLRGTLHRSRESQHHLGEEQDLVTALLAIAAMRLGSRLRYQVCIDPSLRSLSLPPLLLQPIVENAIRHGIDPAIDGGEIRVDAERLGEDLILRVTDTGRGLTTGAPEGIGLSNVRARLAGIYGDKGRLSLFSNPAPRGVIAELRLPARAAAADS